MEIKISSNHILKILYWLSWIIFIGISIDAGIIIVNSIIFMIGKPAPEITYLGHTDLFKLFKADHGHFLVVTSLMATVAIFKATIFHLIIKLLHEKKIDMDHPFNAAVGKFIFTITYLALLTGIAAGMGRRYTEWLNRTGIVTPTLQDMKLAGADVWLFMGVTLFVVAHIFKRGIEIQTENDLTI